MSGLPTTKRVNELTKILGLTGGIASGKSTVSNYFKSINVPLIDADVVAHDVMSAGEPVVFEIAETFGDEYILENGEVDRTKLGDLVFANPDQRRLLNDIVQDEIRQEINHRKEIALADDPDLIVLDIPLLFEGGYDKQVDLVMVVYVDGPTQKKRLLKRNTDLNEEDAENRIKSQMPLDMKAEKADVIIDNNGTVEETVDQIKTWVHVNCPRLKSIT